MNCLHCNTPNESGSNFCNNCGADLTYTTNPKDRNSTTSDNLLFIFLCIIIFITVVQFAIDRLFPDWFNSPMRNVRGLLWMIQNMSYILIPLAIKDKNLKMAGLILTSIAVLYWLYGNVMMIVS